MSKGQKKNEPKIEDIDLYREAVSLSTKLYGLKSNNSAAMTKMRENSLSLVLNIASGLGFWEPQWKKQHIAAAQKCVKELGPLLELVHALGEITSTQSNEFESQLEVLGKKLRAFKRKIKEE